MTRHIWHILGAGALACGLTALGSTALTQNLTVEPAGPQAFSPENAILNTAIPFSVGAREAQQSLRGSFGWATFQEGLVQGIYFRFDPDGYARFSPSPRLDSDVFEVICRPRTHVCMARKGPMTLTLSSTGQVQVKLEQTTTQDQFFLNDGFSDLQIPPRVLGTLDQQLETLLSGGGTLVTRRNGEVLEEVPLTGFPVVSAFLRWIVARQDYTVLPASWPVPKLGGPNPDTLTQPMNWTGAGRAVAVPVAAAAPAAPPMAIDAEPATAMSSENHGMRDAQTLAALQAEVAFLRDMLIAQTGAGALPNLHQQVPQAQMQEPVLDMAAPMATTMQPRNASLAHDLTQMSNELEGLAVEPAHNQGAAATDDTPDGFGKEAKHLHYMTVEMGLDAKTAIMILQLRAQDEVVVMSEAGPTATDLLSGFTPTTLPGAAPGFSSVGGAMPSLTAPAPEQDYQPLTEYFKGLVN